MPNDATWGGQTIISYRGTDNASLLSNAVSGGSDVVNGYGVATGSVDGAQADLAFKFYNAVDTSLNNGIHLDPHGSSVNITLTGHSLGGGLAGLVASVYNKPGLLFDNMPFEQAANNVPLSTNTSFKTDVYGGFGTWNPVISSTSALKADYIQGEFLGWARNGGFNPQNAQITQTFSLDPGTGVILDGVDHGGLQLHSMATAAMVLYADTANIPANWDYAAKYFWTVAYDNTFSQSFRSDWTGFTGALQDSGDYAGIVRTALAYSAIDDGATAASMPFGNTGIVAFFHDANNLGYVLAQPTVSKSLTDTINTDISKAFVQYAGELALNQILQANDAAAVNGVLALSNVANNHTLIVSFDTALWTAAGGGTLPLMAAQSTMVNDLLSQYSYMPTLGMSQFYSNSSTTAIDRVIFAAADSGTTILVDNPHASATKADIFVGGSGADIITGSHGNDIILAGAGSDTIYVSTGKDIIFGDGSYTAKAVDTDILNFTHVTEAVTFTANGYDTPDHLYQGAFYGIEEIMLGNQVVNLSAPLSGTRIFDGGGTDTLQYGIANFAPYNNIAVWDAASHSVYNATATAKDMLLNFATFNFTAGTILPDFRSSAPADFHYLADGVTRQPMPGTVDYSDAPTGANFHLGFGHYNLHVEFHAKVANDLRVFREAV